MLWNYYTCLQAVHIFPGNEIPELSSGIMDKHSEVKAISREQTESGGSQAAKGGTTPCPAQV